MDYVDHMRQILRARNTQTSINREESTTQDRSQLRLRGHIDDGSARLSDQGDLTDGNLELDEPSRGLTWSIPRRCSTSRHWLWEKLIFESRLELVRTDEERTVGETHEAVLTPDRVLDP